MSIDTDVKDDTNIVHDLSVELQGQIVALVKGEANDTGIDVNDEFFKDNCTLSESFDRMSITCIEGMDMNAILGYSFSWRVEMPGTIVSEKTNADSVDGSSAEFISSWDDTRETFEVVSLERKSRGIFGACNK